MASRLPDFDVVSDLLTYDPETGIIRWRKQVGRKINPGKVAGWTNRKGYTEIRIEGKNYPAHRLAWLLHYGEDPHPLTIDHINHKPSDNKIANLRKATSAQNSQNTRKRRSGLKGVSWYRRKGKWRAAITFEKRTMHIGYFDSEQEAHEVYCRYANRLHGEFACHE